MNDIYTKILQALAYVLAAVVCRYLIPWIKAKTGEAKFSRLYDDAFLAVRTYNQTMTPEENQQKKQRAIIFLSEQAERLGISITKPELENLIEGVVNEVKEAAKANQSTNN